VSSLVPRRAAPEAVRPYGDHLDDGLMQLSFTLPVDNGPLARETALALVREMGLIKPEVVHAQALTEGYTYFVMFAQCQHAVDTSQLASARSAVRAMSEEEVDAFVAEQIGRPVVVIGASTGTDTHSVGIDSILNLKGFDGRHGLEAYHWFRTHNLGSQVPNTALLAKAFELGADAILVSQTVTQQGLHLHNLTELVELVEAEGRRREVLLVCGGPRISDELAKELGFDAGFSKGTYPNDVASFIAQEVAARTRRPVEASATAPER
jgi:beta-lysine 5,6-aminomutase beta subunit